MKTISNKSKAIVAIVALLLIAVGIAAMVLINSKNEDTDGNRIETKAYSVIVPEGVKNEASSDEKNIYFTISKPFGEIKASVVQSELNVTDRIQRGTIVESKVTVDGTPTTMQMVNFDRLIRGSSTKPLIRYEVNINKIDKPSSEKYTVVHITAMSRRDLTEDEIADVKKEAQSIIDSLNIK